MAIPHCHLQDILVLFDPLSCCMMEAYVSYMHYKVKARRWSGNRGFIGKGV